MVPARLVCSRMKQLLRQILKHETKILAEMFHKPEIRMNEIFTELLFDFTVGSILWLQLAPFIIFWYVRFNQSVYL